MADEQDYVAHIVDINTALEVLHGVNGIVMLKAYQLWQQSLRLQQQTSANNAANGDGPRTNPTSRQRESPQNDTDPAEISRMGQQESPSELPAAHVNLDAHSSY